jgi:hypothetical protein
VRDRNTPQKVVRRSQLVLLAGEGIGAVEVAMRVGKSVLTARRWRRRYAVKGVDGLLKDATRPPGRKPLTARRIKQVVNLTLNEKPPDGKAEVCYLRCPPFIRRAITPLRLSVRAHQANELYPSLLLQLLHAMLLIGEHVRREGERAAYSHVGERDNNHAISIFGLNVAGNAALIAEVGDS